MVEGGSAVSVILDIIRTEHKGFLQGKGDTQSFAEFCRDVDRMHIPPREFEWLRSQVKAYLVANYRARSFSTWKFLKDLRSHWETHTGKHTLDTRRKQLEITYLLRKRWLMSGKKDVTQWEQTFDFMERLVTGEPADDAWRDTGRGLGLRTDVHPMAYDLYHYCPPQFRERFCDLLNRWRTRQTEPVSEAARVADALAMPNPEDDELPFARPVCWWEGDLT